MVFAQNVVDIAAAPETVWSQLVDCVAWPQWYEDCSDVSILGGGSLISANSKFRFKTLGFYFEPEIHRRVTGRLGSFLSESAHAQQTSDVSRRMASFFEDTGGGD
jgi:hypothetical protein